MKNKIEVPAPAGDGQYGTAWWLQKKDYDRVFKYNIIDRNKDYKESCFQSGGVITNFERNGNLEKIWVIALLSEFQAGLPLQMLIKHVTLVVQINAVGKAKRLIIAIIEMVAPTPAAIEQYVIGMLLIIFVKILLLGVELGD